MGYMMKKYLTFKTLTDFNKFSEQADYYFGETNVVLPIVYENSPYVTTIINSDFPNFLILGLTTKDLPRFSPSQIDCRPPLPDINDIVEAAIDRAETKGREIFCKLRKENVMLGIEQSLIDGRPATDVVLERGAHIMAALTSGSTKAAIRFLKAFPVEQRDNKFLTTARLLSIVNELEQFHGLPISSEL
jgi:hypothetical protein